MKRNLSLLLALTMLLGLLAGCSMKPPSLCQSKIDS